MDLDYLRQLNVFNPHDFKDRKVTIVGAGATGSYIVFLLAQIGIKNISIWDHDIVEEHNLPNQMFFIEHIGEPKVEALKDVIKRKCGFEIETHNEKVVDQNIAANYVFLLTDTMASRKEIYKNCIDAKRLFIDLVIETRMDADNGRVYAFKPGRTAQSKEWLDTLYGDEESSESVCGATFSVAPTAAYLASMAVWKLIQHFDVEYGPNHTEKKGKETELYNESIFQLGPEEILNRRFALV